MTKRIFPKTGPFALLAAVFALASGPALAVDLPFSADCRQYAQIAVAGPNTGIAFRKNPGNNATRNATATIFDISGANNITIQAGVGTCFYQTAGTDSYCFQARSSNQIANVNAVAGNNHLGAPACQ